MSNETIENDQNEEEVVDENVNDESTQENESADTSAPVQPEFAELRADGRANSEQSTDLSRLNDVQVTIAAELGRTTVPIQEILKLTEGSVFELNRSIEFPVELRAHDVPLGNGEVVVVDGNFAIRIQQIYKKD